MTLGVGLGVDRNGERWKTRRRPLERAAPWGRLLPDPAPEPAALALIAQEARELRGHAPGGFDLVIDLAPGEPTAPWEAAGATWILTDFDFPPRLREVEAVIDAGPGR